MGITVTEKTELRGLINNRINKAKAQILQDNDTAIKAQRADFERQIEEQLGIAGYSDKIADLEKQISALNEEKKRLEAEAARKADTGWYNNIRSIVVNRAAQLTADWQRKQFPKLAELEEEQERLLETVWIATSPSQIKELLDGLNNILGTKRTPLEDLAHKIVPME